jgi:hypothetical protein
MISLAYELENILNRTFINYKNWFRIVRKGFGAPDFLSQIWYTKAMILEQRKLKFREYKEKQSIGIMS